MFKLHIKYSCRKFSLLSFGVEYKVALVKLIKTRNKCTFCKKICCMNVQTVKTMYSLDVIDQELKNIKAGCAINHEICLPLYSCNSISFPCFCSSNNQFCKIQYFTFKSRHKTQLASTGNRPLFL